MMYNNPALMHSILSHMADNIGAYACHQVCAARDGRAGRRRRR